MAKNCIIFKRLILPITVAGLLALLSRPIYLTEGQIDYLLAWILIGFPFGVRKMFLILLPSKFDLAGTVGVCFLNVLVGGIIGGFVLIGQILSGIFCTAKLLLRR
jgi:hypothetical protein